MTTTKAYATGRLVHAGLGTHMGFVAYDPEAREVLIPRKAHRPFSPRAPFAFARCAEAISCALSADFDVSLPFEVVGIGSTYRVEGF